MQFVYVHVNNPFGGVTNYSRTFSCMLCDLYKTILADNVLRSKLLVDVFGADASMYESKYQNNEPDTVQILLSELQLRLDNGQSGYFKCQVADLAGGVSF